MPHIERFGASCTCHNEHLSAGIHKLQDAWQQLLGYRSVNQLFWLPQLAATLTNYQDQIAQHSYAGKVPNSSK